MPTERYEQIKKNFEAKVNNTQDENYALNLTYAINDLNEALKHKEAEQDEATKMYQYMEKDLLPYLSENGDITPAFAIISSPILAAQIDRDKEALDIALANSIANYSSLPNKSEKMIAAQIKYNKDEILPYACQNNLGNTVSTIITTFELSKKEKDLVINAIKDGTLSTDLFNDKQHLLEEGVDNSFASQLAKTAQKRVSDLQKLKKGKSLSTFPKLSHEEALDILTSNPSKKTIAHMQANISKIDLFNKITTQEQYQAMQAHGLLKGVDSIYIGKKIAELEGQPIEEGVSIKTPEGIAAAREQAQKKLSPRHRSSTVSIDVDELDTKVYKEIIKSKEYKNIINSEDWQKLKADILNQNNSSKKIRQKIEDHLTRYATTYPYQKELDEFKQALLDNLEPALKVSGSNKLYNELSLYEYENPEAAKSSTREINFAELANHLAKDFSKYPIDGIIRLAQDFRDIDKKEFAETLETRADKDKILANIKKHTSKLLPTYASSELEDVMKENRKLANSKEAKQQALEDKKNALTKRKEASDELAGQHHLATNLFKAAKKKNVNEKEIKDLLNKYPRGELYEAFDIIKNAGATKEYNKIQKIFSEWSLEIAHKAQEEQFEVGKKTTTELVEQNDVDAQIADAKASYAQKPEIWSTMTDNRLANDILRASTKENKEEELAKLAKETQRSKLAQAQATLIELGREELYQDFEKKYLEIKQKNITQGENFDRERQNLLEAEEQEYAAQTDAIKASKNRRNLTTEVVNYIANAITSNTKNRDIAVEALTPDNKEEVSSVVKKLIQIKSEIDRGQFDNFVLDIEEECKKKGLGQDFEEALKTAESGQSQNSVNKNPSRNTTTDLNNVLHPSPGQSSVTQPKSLRERLMERAKTLLKFTSSIPTKKNDNQIGK